MFKKVIAIAMAATMAFSVARWQQWQQQPKQNQSKHQLI